MVKRLILALVLVLSLSIGATTSTKAYSVYQQGNPSSTYVGYFNSILNNYSGFDYVIWRNAEYQYCLVVGKTIDYSNNFYSCNDCDIYTINSNNNYNTATSIQKSHITNFSLNNSNRILVYSNLGDMPNVYERGENYAFSIVYLLVLFGVSILIWSILKFGSR